MTKHVKMKHKHPNAGTVTVAGTVYAPDDSGTYAVAPEHVDAVAAHGLEPAPADAAPAATDEQTDDESSEPLPFDQVVEAAAKKGKK